MIKQEMHFEIQDSYFCANSCPGCQVSIKERKKDSSYNNILDVDLVLKKIKEYSLLNINIINNINISYTIGDHLLLGKDNVIKLYNKARETINSILPNNKENTISMSFSLSGDKKHISSDLVDISQQLGDIKFIPVFVLNPLYLNNKFYPNYEENLQKLKMLFGKIGLVVNISTEVVKTITPFEFKQLMDKYNLDEIIMQWQVTPFNYLNTFNNIKLCLNWLLEYESMTNNNIIGGTSYSTIFGNIIKMLESEKDSNLTETLSKYIPDIIKHNILIDNFGNISPKFEAIGDLPHSTIFGYKSLGNIYNDSIEEATNKINVVVNDIVGDMNHTECLECEFLHICSISGLHIYNRNYKSYIKEKSVDGCYNGLSLHFLNHILNLKT